MISVDLFINTFLCWEKEVKKIKVLLGISLLTHGVTFYRSTSFLNAL